MHEQAHVQIYKHYGIDSKVSYFKSFPDLTTIPEKNCPTESCILAHNINEIVGYHIIVLYLLIFIGFIFSNKHL